MTENQILKKLKKDMGRLVHFYKIETGSTEYSIPDTFYCGYNFCGWIEIKQISKPVKKIVIPYRPGQRNWLENHKKFNLNVFILLYYHNKFYLLNDFRKEFKDLGYLKMRSLWYESHFKSNVFFRLLMGGIKQ